MPTTIFSTSHVQSGLLHRERLTEKLYKYAFEKVNRLSSITLNKKYLILVRYFKSLESIIYEKNHESCILKPEVVKRPFSKYCTAWKYYFNQLTVVLKSFRSSPLC